MPTHIYTVDAKWVEHYGAQPIAAKLCITSAQLKVMFLRGQSTKIAQFYGIVIPGTIIARHIFMGLRRPLLSQFGNMHGDKEKRIYSWKSAFDCEWEGTPHQGGPKRIVPPPDRVFVVIVSPNHNTLQHPDIAGWIEQWSWVAAASDLEEAPVDWQSRYDQKLWTRP